MKYYSATTNGFYDNGIHKNMPEDSVQITDNLYNQMISGQSSGSIISSDINDLPVLIDYVAPEPSAEEVRNNAMLAGVEFEGVMCSAFKEDQWGLSSVRAYVLAGSEIPFKFVNQNVIILNDENLAAFEAVWIPFRASFFVI
tara:strand:+ start:2691 stop:3116 length:426 start_codon:yes stop_codon:yes gene_type:complete